MKILAGGFQKAFDELCVRELETMTTGSEPEVTALLEGRLNSMIDEDLVWGQLVLCVARGKESISFDGSQLEKRPDLSIYLTDRKPHFPLVVEAKILDGSGSRTVASYCGDHGLLRFVKGEYAWASREAFMLAYVRDGSSIDLNLRPRLANTTASNPPTHRGLDLAYTQHGREFTYPLLPRNSPGSISVWHLWLSCGRRTKVGGPGAKGNVWVRHRGNAPVKTDRLKILSRSATGWQG